MMNVFYFVINMGGDPFGLQKILGHSSMDIVRKCVNIYGNEIKKDFDRFNVLDRLSQEKEVIKIKKKYNRYVKDRNRK